MEQTVPTEERLADALGVSPEAARLALEAAGGDVLDAAAMLESDRPAGERRLARYTTDAAPETVPAPDPGPEPDAGEVLRAVGRVLLGCIRRPMANELTVTPRNAAPVRVPVIIALALLLAATWVTVGLLALAVVTGCRLALRGPDLDGPAEGLNGLLDRLGTWTDDLLKRLFSPKK